MLLGTFTERSGDPHCRLRDELLSADSVLKKPDIVPLVPPAGFPGSAGVPDSAARQLMSSLREHGLALAELDEPLSTPDFRRLGALLGTPVPETDPAVLPYVDEGVVLNLVADAGHTREVALQPFASTALTLHSEGSGRATADQPRYVVLMCVEPGDSSQAVTALVPMDAVGGDLSPQVDRLLRTTRYAGAPGVPTVARERDGRTVYSFRDFHGVPLRWSCDDEHADEETVNQALRHLLERMYAPRHCYGVTWTRGLLVVIDNTRYFHGRTAGRAASAGRLRHLRRLRIR
ncbi:TauD/TfdA family dioxygenase [Streptomyces sp. NPDC001770]